MGEGRIRKNYGNFFLSLPVYILIEQAYQGVGCDLFEGFLTLPVQS